MKRAFAFLILILSLSPIYALQTIRGKIVDGNTSEPLDFVNITLMKSSSTVPTTGVISDEKGQFELPKVPNGNYTLKISFVGYNTLEMPIRVTEKDLNMGIIRLMEDSKALSEVEIVAQGTQMRFEIDKKVFSVDQNIAAAGGSATEVLQNIPSVDVDNEGNISLRNSENVEVWINGKPSGLTAENRADILQQMPAESLESVEVMTNPSAKFNPEGTAGIINLVMKKNRRAGYFGSVSAGTSWSQGALPGYNLGANVNFNKGKWDSYVNLGFRNMKFVGEGYTERYSLDNQNDTTSSLIQSNHRLFGYKSMFVRAGTDFRLHDNHTIGLSGFGMFGSSGGYTDISYQQTNYTNSALSRDYNRFNQSDGSRPGMSISLDYKWDINKDGSNLMSSLSYSTHQRHSEESYLQTINAETDTTSYILQDNRGRGESLQFKLDYTHKFMENDRLELGWQSTWFERFGPNSARDLLTDQELYAYFNEFRDNEDIHAAYATYGNRFKNLSLQGGLRAEYFQRNPTNATKDINGKIINEDYGQDGIFQLFPSFFASYSFPNDHELQFNATRRVNRPRGRQVNPFRDYSDSTSISYGNLDLTPMYSAAIELNYLKAWEQHTISSAIYHRYTDDVIQRVSFMNNENVLENTFMNVTKSANTGFEFVSKNTLFKILNLTSSLNLYHSKIFESTYTSPYDASKVTTIPEQQNFNWSARLIGNIMISKTSSAQITGYYSSPRLLAQGQTFANYAMDVGYRQSFFNRKVNLNLSIRDIFNTRGWRSNTWGDGFYQTSENRFSKRMISLRLSYNFGNMQPKRRKTPQSQMDMNGDGEMDGFDEY